MVVSDSESLNLTLLQNRQENLYLQHKTRKICYKLNYNSRKLAEAEKGVGEGDPKLKKELENTKKQQMKVMEIILMQQYMFKEVL